MKVYVVRRVSDGFYLKSDGFFAKVDKTPPRIFARKCGASHSLKNKKDDREEYEILELTIEGLK